MALVWNEIRPMDGFRVYMVEPLTLFQMKVLTHLYQPLIGSQSYALYLSLVLELDGSSADTFERNHQYLMNLLKTPLDKIYEARLRLEALGLIKTYKLQQEGDVTLFEYELCPPLSAKAFFEDDILSICLYNQVGTHRYRDLRSRYSLKQHTYANERQEITKEFHEVFSTISPSELVIHQGSELQEQIQSIDNLYPLAEKHADQATASLHFDRVTIDMELLKGYMMNGLDLEQIINEDTLPVIKKMTYFYRLDEWSLSRLLQDSLDTHESLDIDRFRAKAKDWYRIEYGGKPPHLTQAIQPMSQKVMIDKKDMTKDEKHLYRLENMSPLELLEAYQGGGKVAEADIKLVEELLIDYQLNPGVINLLVEYIYLTNDFKLPRNLVTKVAAHWKRLKIHTVKQAQELAKKEHQQYKAWKEKQKEGKDPVNRMKQRPVARENIRQDKLPEWIVKQEEREKQQNKNHQHTLTEAQKNERMEELLKALGEWEE